MNQEKIEKRVKRIVSELEEAFNKLLKKEIVQAVKTGIELDMMGDLAEQLEKVDKLMNAEEVS